MNVLYKNKVYEVVCPEDLKFPPGVIRTVLIKRGDKKFITHVDELTKIESNFKSIEAFL